MLEYAWASSQESNGVELHLQITKEWQDRKAFALTIQATGANGRLIELPEPAFRWSLVLDAAYQYVKPGIASWTYLIPASETIASLVLRVHQWPPAELAPEDHFGALGVRSLDRPEYVDVVFGGAR